MRKRFMQVNVKQVKLKILKSIQRFLSEADSTVLFDDFIPNKLSEKEQQNNKPPCFSDYATNRSLAQMRIVSVTT